MEVVAGYGVVAGALLFIVVAGAEAFKRWRWRQGQLARIIDGHLALGREFAAGAAGTAGPASASLRNAVRDQWNGYRKFRVTRKVAESDSGGVRVASFYLCPHDGARLGEFNPGQFLTFRLREEAGRTPLVRCYSLSGLKTNDNEYRVTIKREGRDDPKAECDSASCYFHDQVQENSIIDVAPPSGGFTLDRAAGRPIVFIAGGVGLTPFLAMCEHLERHAPEREAWLFYGIDNRKREIMSETLRRWAERPNFHLVTCYSDPSTTDGADDECDERSRIDADLLRRWLPSSNYEFFICAPPAMTRAVAEGLRDWGVPSSSIHLEMFKAQTVHEASRDNPAFSDLEPCEVTFESAGKTLRWAPESGTVLDLATGNDVYLPSGCRAGSCGTCATPVMRGAFRYLSKPEFPVPKDSCLVCIAVPVGDTGFA